MFREKSRKTEVVIQIFKNPRTKGAAENVNDAMEGVYHMSNTTNTTKSQVFNHLYVRNTNLDEETLEKKYVLWHLNNPHFIFTGQ